MSTNPQQHPKKIGETPGNPGNPGNENTGKTQKKWSKKQMWNMVESMKKMTSEPASSASLAAITTHTTKDAGDQSIANPAPQQSPQQEQQPQFRTNVEEDICKECFSGIIQWTDDNVPICNYCGTMVHENWVDHSPEWKFFKSDEKNHGNNPTRCGNPINPLLEESSISCKVILPSNSTSEMRRIKRWMDWQSMPHNEKTLYDAFQYISTMAQLAGIQKTIIDRAFWWYKEFSSREQHRGVNLAALKAASLDMASREYDCPRTAFEIAEIFNIDKKDASKGCSIAEDIRSQMARAGAIYVQTPVSQTNNPNPNQSTAFLIEQPTSISAPPRLPSSSIFPDTVSSGAISNTIDNNSTSNTAYTNITANTNAEYEELFTVSPASFIERYCSKLNINQELTVLSKFIAHKIEREHLITDNLSHAISAGIIFFVSHHCNLPITKTDIKHISGISEVTINKCFKKIENFRDHLLPNCIVSKYTSDYPKKNIEITGYKPIKVSAQLVVAS
jgi:transcription initiation factor TFIIIB Brf1 subunit/transcription initiation factor TFIIB